MIGDSSRRDELAANLAVLEQRVQAACAAAGRARDEITVIAVTKTFPASDIRLLASLGITDIGENRDQEAAPKVAACADLPVTWHFVGRLQTNKCRSVATYADVVHSIDRPHLVDALAAAAQRSTREIACLVQVSLDNRPARGGAEPPDVPGIAARVAGTARLRLAGVMAIAPLDSPARTAFGRLAAVAATVRTEFPGASVISAGMSGDLDDAIACGATHVRVGTALLGSRAPVR